VSYLASLAYLAVKAVAVSIVVIDACAKRRRYPASRAAPAADARAES
jgi:hypothetical protein